MAYDNRPGRESLIPVPIFNTTIKDLVYKNLLTRLVKRSSTSGPFCMMWVSHNFPPLIFLKTIWFALPCLLILFAENLHATSTCVFIIVESYILLASWSSYLFKRISWLLMPLPKALLDLLRRSTAIFWWAICRFMLASFIAVLSLFTLVSFILLRQVLPFIAS